MSSKNYRYKGISHNGELLTGNLSASNKQEAVVALTNQGITPVKITKNFALKSSRIKNQQLAAMVRQFASLINANIPLLKALKIMECSYKKQVLRKLLQELQRELQNGKTLCAAFKNHPQYFDELFCNLIYVGEQTGNLDTILNYIADYKEKSIELRRKVKKATLYPLTVAIIALVVTTILLLFVVPQFAKLFHGFGASLPLYTRTIIKIAQLVKANFFTNIIVITGLIITIKALKKTLPKFALFLDRLVLRLPVIGTAIKKAVIARFSLILAITYSAGLPLAKSLQVTSKIITNRLYQQAILQAQHEIENGRALTPSLTGSNPTLFPARVEQMLTIGEEGGTLELMLRKIASYYASEISYLIDNMNNLLEPLIMVILAILVGGLVIGMYLPIFKLGTII